jgi:nicotinamide-nucleotide amidase
MTSPAHTLANYLKTNNLSIAFAESITCGLVAHRLGNIIGASDFLKGSIVCYDEAVKTNLLKISKTLLKQYTAESQQVTDELAKNLSSLFKADIYAAVTGLATSGGSETARKPVGTVFYSIYYHDNFYRLKKKFNGPPLSIKKQACDELYKYIYKVAGKFHGKNQMFQRQF